MKKIILALVTLVILFFSFCKKDTNVTIPGTSKSDGNATTSAPDSIYFRDISDDTVSVIKSYSWIQMGMNSCWIPYPSIDSVTHFLDIDSNGASDFILFSKVYETPATGGWQPCSQYGNWQTMFVPVDSSNFTSFNLFQFGDTINQNKTFNNYSHYISFEYNPNHALGNEFNNGGRYVAIKHVSNNKTMYGWILLDTIQYPTGMIVKEFAINLTSGNKILCGQKH